VNFSDHSSETFVAHLEQFHGPLDLLLYLVKQHEVEITELPIVSITEQYLNMVKQLETFNPEIASEFLLMASTLVEIKSKMLLPREEIDLSDIEDPRSNLIEQLLAYREFKEKAKILSDLKFLRSQKFQRGFSSRVRDPEENLVDLGDVEIWDLLTLFQKIVEETTLSPPTLLAYDDTPVEEHMKQIITEITRLPNQSHSFRRLIQKLAKDRLQLVGLFIALLELTRLKRLRLEQVRDFSDIHIVAADDLSEDEIPTLEGPHEEHFTLPEEHPAIEKQAQEDDIVFDLETSSAKGQIDDFYYSNFRKDESVMDTPQDLPENGNNEEASYSLDVDSETLDIIQQKMPEIVLQPSPEELDRFQKEHPDFKKNLLPKD
jgi:segregation and condensation protein A